MVQNIIEKKVFIILLNYNGYDDTVACIKSLRKVDYVNYQIIIVDNASIDDSYERLRTENPDCILIHSLENNGFSAGNNIGIHYALEHNADYILMLNNDTEVKADFLKKMMEVADENTVITPTIYYHSNPNEIWYADGKINFSKCIVSNGKNSQSKYCNYASGCCLLIPRKVVEIVGDWAEEYFMYYEDMDYSLRIINNDFKIYYKNDAIVYHKVGRSAGRKSRLNIYYNVRNRFYVIKKFGFGWKCKLYTYGTRIIKGIVGKINKTADDIIFVAVYDYLAGKMHKSDRGF